VGSALYVALTKATNEKSTVGAPDARQTHISYTRLADDDHLPSNGDSEIDEELMPVVGSDLEHGNRDANSDTDEGGDVGQAIKTIPHARSTIQ